MSCFTGGKCITEDSVFGNIEKHISDQKNRGKDKITNACNNNQPVSENPGSSHATPVKKFDQKVAQQNVSATKVLAKFKSPRKVCSKTPIPPAPTPPAGPSAFHLSDDEVSQDEDEQSHLCCVCKGFATPNTSNLPGIFILKWAQCDHCSHWTHLGYCTKVRVVWRYSEFLCPCCDWSTNKEEE